LSEAAGEASASKRVVVAACGLWPKRRLFLQNRKRDIFAPSMRSGAAIGVADVEQHVYSARMEPMAE